MEGMRFAIIGWRNGKFMCRFPGTDYNEVLSFKPNQLEEVIEKTFYERRKLI